MLERRYLLANTYFTSGQLVQICVLKMKCFSFFVVEIARSASYWHKKVVHLTANAATDTPTIHTATGLFLPVQEFTSESKEKQIT